MNLFEVTKVPPINFDRLKQRIAEGGAANSILKAFYIASYKGTRPLTDLKTHILDAEGKAILFSIIFMRSVPGWNDEEYFEHLNVIQAIECPID